MRGFNKQTKTYDWWLDPDLASSSVRATYLASFKHQHRLVRAYHAQMLGLIGKRGAAQKLLVSFGCLGMITTLLLGIVATTYPVPGYALSPPADPTIQACGVRSPAEIERYNGPAAPATPISTSEYPVGGIYNYLYAASPSPRFFIRIGQTITTYDAANKNVLATFTVPDASYGSFTVDEIGNYYFSTQLNGIFKYNQAGTQLWHVTVPMPLDRPIYSYGNGSNFRIGVEGRGLNGSVVFDANGVRQADNIVVGVPHFNAATNHVISIDNGYVRIYDATGMNQLFYIGTTIAPNDPGPTHFYVTAGAEDLPDGRLIVMDASGLMFFSNTGSFLGKISQDTFVQSNGAIQFVQRNLPIYVYNNTIYYANAANGTYAAGVSSVPISTAEAVMQTPQGRPTGMGIGAGPYVAAANNYFPSGTTPQVYMQFYPWWSQVGGGLTGTYTIRDATQIKANTSVPAVGYNVAVNSGAVTNIPVTLPSTAPGYYEMDAKLMQNGTVVGASCLHYSIGAAGQTIGNVPGGGDDQAVNYAKATGQKLLRGSAFNIDNFIPNGDPNSTAPMVFPAGTDTAVQAIAAAASAAGVTYEIQLADGSQLQKALVANGTWGARVQELVTHFKPWIHTWEAWNEPNNTYGGATQFTNNVLKPFYTGVKAADPSATVVGGGILGVDLGYWDGIIAAGGLDYMDVAGDHTYTGHNRSFEEQDQIGQLRALQAKFAAAGHPGLDIYDTESGFWENGPASFWSQGDKQVRKMILESSIGLNYLSNFQNSSCYNDGSVVWGNNCGFYTTGMLADAEFAAQTNDKHFVRMVPLSIPHSYAAEYATNNGNGNRVVVVWTEDFDATIVPQLSDGAAVSSVDEYGKATTGAAYQPVTIGGAVTYLAVPAGKTLTMTPTEAYEGANLAIASAGVTATATSAAPATPVTNVNDGAVTMAGHGNNFDGGVSIWTQHYTDTNPTVTLSFSQPKQIDRVYIASQGINSVQTGLRSYDVQVDKGDGTFQTVATVRNEFYNRTKTVRFAAQTVSKLRITNMSVNYSGYADGLPPGFWPDPATYASDDVWMGQATIYEIEAYAPGTNFVPPASPPPVSPVPPVTTTGSNGTASPAGGNPAVETSNGATANNSGAAAGPGQTSQTATAASQLASATRNIVDDIADSLQLDGTTNQTDSPAPTSATSTTPKPSTAAQPPKAQPSLQVKQKTALGRKVRAIIMVSGIGIVSAGLLFLAYELYRHRHHAALAFGSGLNNDPRIHVG